MTVADFIPLLFPHTMQELFDKRGILAVIIMLLQSPVNVTTP